MDSRLWIDSDFAVNKAFWAHWGHPASLPFRVMNLRDLCAMLSEKGLILCLYGSTLRDVQSHGRLGPDHDDDLVIAATRKQISEAIAQSESSLDSGGGIYCN